MVTLIGPEWVPAVSALIGGLTGAGGTWIANRFNLKQQREQRAHDAAQRENERALILAEAAEKAAADNLARQRALALELHRDCVAWLTAYRMTQRDQPHQVEVPIPILKPVSTIMNRAAEVSSLGDNQLSKTSLDIYSYFSCVTDDWRSGGVIMPSFSRHQWLETFERNVHSIAHDLALSP